MRNLVLIGAPGSGKSTLAKKLGEENCYGYVSSGQIARQLAEDDSHTAEALQRGDYAPESAMRAELNAHLENATVAGPWVLEGFPRTLAQVAVLMEILPELPVFVYVWCPLFTCMRRAVLRKREWDHPDAIASRFEAFQRDTIPVLNLIKDNGGVFTHSQSIDNSLSLKSAWRDLLKLAQ